MNKSRSAIMIALILSLSLPIFNQTNNIPEFKILQYLKKNDDETHYKVIEILNNTDNPSNTIIHAVLRILRRPKIHWEIKSEYSKIIVKWGKLTIPFLIKALEDKSDINHLRAPGLILAISQEHGTEITLPAIPGLVKCIKDKDFQERYDALWALSVHGKQADDMIPVLTEEMRKWKDDQVHWSISIAKALIEIAGPDYQPIQPFLEKDKELSRQYVNEVDEIRFELTLGFDVSWINFKEEKIEHLLLVGADDMCPFRIILYMGMKYKIAIRENKIEFISTSDINFRTDEDLKIGDTVEKLKKINYSDFIKVPGWGYYFKLKRGWNAAFCEGSPCTNEKLTDASKISCFFKGEDSLVTFDEE